MKLKMLSRRVELPSAGPGDGPRHAAPHRHPQDSARLLMVALEKPLSFSQGMSQIARVAVNQ